MALVGLFYVKWKPYGHQLSLAVSPVGYTGKSILMGHDAASPSPSWQAAWDYAYAYGQAVWKALLLALLLGGAIQALVPSDWIRRLLGSPGAASVAMGGAASVPSMMCTCCAAPIAVGLRQTGASQGSALSFWLGNPELNPAVLLLIALVLGWRWMLLRLLLGLALVFGAGWCTDYFAKLKVGSAIKLDLPPPRDTREASQPVGIRWLRECWRLFVGLVPEYIVLVFALGAMRFWLFPAVHFGSAGGIWWVAGMAIAGTLFVIPTAAEIPIVQTLTALGLGAPAAAALLVTLPAVSLPSATMMARALPAKVLVSVGCAVVVTGMLAGGIAWAMRF